MARNLSVAEAGRATSVEDLDHTDLQKAFGEEAVRMGVGVRVEGKYDPGVVVGYLLDGRVVGESAMVYLGLDDPETPSDEPDGDETVHAIIDVSPSRTYYWSDPWGQLRGTIEVEGDNRWEQHANVLAAFDGIGGVAVASTHPNDADPVANARVVEARIEDLLSRIAAKVDERLEDHETTRANAKAGVHRALGNRAMRRAGVKFEEASAGQIPSEDAAADTISGDATADTETGNMVDGASDEGDEPDVTATAAEASVELAEADETETGDDRNQPDEESDESAPVTDTTEGVVGGAPRQPGSDFLELPGQAVRQQAGTTSSAE